jgi:tetratricopeptide (TPR) repeat protein
MASGRWSRKENLAKYHEAMQYVKRLENTDENPEDYRLPDKGGGRIPVTAAKSKPLAKLSTIQDRDMVAGKTYKNRVFLCKTIAEPFFLTALQLMAEDLDGTAVRVALHNFTKMQRSPALLELFPVGTLFAICDPYYHSFADSGTGVRCDNPANVHVVRPWDPIVAGTKWASVPPPSGMGLSTNAAVISSDGDAASEPAAGSGKTDAAVASCNAPISVTADECRLCGNEQYAKGLYKHAIQSYLHALELEPNSIPVMGNLAQSYLQLKDYASAVKYAELALTIDPDNVKNQGRRDKAKEGLASELDCATASGTIPTIPMVESS